MAWQWECEFAERHMWQPYAPPVNAQLCAAAPGASVTIEMYNTKRGGTTRFVVDPVRMVQVNTLTGFVRRVRRRPLSADTDAVMDTHTPDDGGAAAAGSSDAVDEALLATFWAPLPAAAAGAAICAICLDPLADPSQTCTAVKLSACDDAFHEGCIRRVVEHNAFQCPSCRRQYGVRVGNQPPGVMVIEKHPPGAVSLDGVGPRCGTIVIKYTIPSGVQGPHHPHPGQPYSGTQRRAYLPDDDAGRAVLARLLTAWDRRLIFTVGESVTSGCKDTVVWAGIHHKTSVSGGAKRHGYPDDAYLDRVRDELAAKGVE